MSIYTLCNGNRSPDNLLTVQFDSVGPGDVERKWVPNWQKTKEIEEAQQAYRRSGTTRMDIGSIQLTHEPRNSAKFLICPSDVVQVHNGIAGLSPKDIIKAANAAGQLRVQLVISKVPLEL